MEILYPDVVGSGGAPKRIMKPRRRNPDSTPIAQAASVEQTVIDPALDSSLYSQTPSHPTSQPMQQVGSQIPTPSIPQSVQRPTSTVIPPRSSIAPPNPNALTPPDESTANSQSRKRPNPDASAAYADKRRGRPSRFSSNFYQQATPGTSSASAAAASSFTAASFVEDGIVSLAEALRARTPPRWPEQALEIFFREFAEEDADLQLKIAEKALTDDNKAMVFVKMTPLLRSHWVSRLREVHMRNIGGGLGLGRVGEDVSQTGPTAL